MTVEFYQTKEMPFPSAERFHVVKCDKILNHLLKYISMTNLHRKSSNRFDLFYRNKFYTQEGISYFNGGFLGGGGLILLKCSDFCSKEIYLELTGKPNLCDFSKDHQINQTCWCLIQCLLSFWNYNAFYLWISRISYW